MLPGTETSELDAGLGPADNLQFELPRLFSLSGQPQQLLFPPASAPPSDALPDNVVAAADSSEAVETEPQQQPEPIADVTIRTVVDKSSQDGSTDEAQAGVPLPRPPRCLGVGSASADTGKACDILRLREAQSRHSGQTMGDGWEARHTVCTVGPPVAKGQGPGSSSSVPLSGYDDAVNTLATLFAAIRTVVSSQNDVDRTLKRDRGKVPISSDSPITDYYVYAPQLGDVGYYIYQSTDQAGGRTFAADVISVQASPTTGVMGYLVAASAQENTSSGLPASGPKRDGLLNIMQRLRTHLASLRHDKSSHTQMVDKTDHHASQPHEELSAMDEAHLEEVIKRVIVGMAGQTDVPGGTDKELPSALSRQKCVDPSTPLFVAALRLSSSLTDTAVPQGLLVARPTVDWDDDLDPVGFRPMDSPILPSPLRTAQSDGIALERSRRSDASGRQLSCALVECTPLDRLATRSSSNPFAYFAPTAGTYSVYGGPTTNFTRADKSPAESAMTSIPPLLGRQDTSERLNPPAVLSSLGRDPTLDLSPIEIDAHCGRGWEMDQPSLMVAQLPPCDNSLFRPVDFHSPHCAHAVSPRLSGTSIRSGSIDGLVRSAVDGTAPLCTSISASYVAGSFQSLNP